VYLRRFWVQRWQYRDGKFLGARECLALVLGMGAIALSTDEAFAQITPDNSLGAESSIFTNNQILGGAQRGTNLFHSFREFNVGAGQTVNFAKSFGNGSAGVVFVQTPNAEVSVDNSSIFSQVTSSGNGDAGGILITEAGTISLNNATVKTANNSSRSGGGILLSARDGVRVENSQITSETINQPDDGFSVIQIDASQGSVTINQ